MANFSSTYPSTRPVFNADFSNAGRLDSRITFSRSDTPPTYAAPSAVHYWSNEKHLSSDNLLLQSSDFDTSWSKQGLATPTGGQSDPAGGTDGFTLVEDNNGGYHRIYQSMSQTGDLALTVYAKQTTGTRYLILTLFNASNDYEAAVFDLAGGAAATSSGSSSTYTSVSTTQTASGDSYYKCVLKATGTVTTVSLSLNDSASAGGINSSGLDGYAGDGSSSIDVAFASLSSVGSQEYLPTTTQIAREYAPTLKSVSTAGQPRFEYSPTDSASMGLLIEGSSTNLFNYSEEFQNGYWTISDVTRFSNVAIAPNGELAADLIVADSTGSAGIHYLGKSYPFTSGNTYTFSVYVKGVNSTEFTLQGGNTSTYAAASQFNITGAGSISNTSAGSATIESVGNGWYRCSVTGTAPVTASTNAMFKLISGGTGTYDGDDYSGVLLWGAQLEQASFASSYIKVEGSTVTRAADSASMDLTQAGFNGGPFSIVSETEGGQGVYPRAWTLSDGTLNNRLTFYRNSGTATTNTDWFCYGASENSAQVSSSVAGSASAGKLAVSYDTNDVSFCASGGTVVNDTSAVIPKSITTLIFGAQTNGTANKLNGHVKRVALYGEALSDTNLQALTS